MGGEEALGTFLELLYGVDDVEVGGRAVGYLQDLLVTRNLLEGIREAFGIAGQLDRAGVGEVLPLAAYGELQQTGKDRGQDRENDGDEDHYQLDLPASLALPSPTTSPPETAQEEVGDENGGTDEDTDEHGVADVVVAHVGHLVRDDALQFVPVQLLEQARGYGYGGVLRAAARGEGVGGRVLDDVDLRHRQAAGDGHLLDDVEEDGGVLVGYLSSPGGGEHHPVAAVVAREARDGAHDEGEGEPEESLRGV